MEHVATAQSAYVFLVDLDQTDLTFDFEFLSLHFFNSLFILLFLHYFHGHLQGFLFLLFVELLPSPFLPEKVLISD